MAEASITITDGRPQRRPRSPRSVGPFERSLARSLAAISSLVGRSAILRQLRTDVGRQRLALRRGSLLQRFRDRLRDFTNVERRHETMLAFCKQLAK